LIKKNGHNLLMDAHVINRGNSGKSNPLGGLGVSESEPLHIVDLCKVLTETNPMIPHLEP
jgi:hypothetical protein